MAGANAGEIKAKLTLESAEFQRGMQQARKDMEDGASSADRLRTSLDLVQKGAAIMGGAAVAGIGASVKIAADFESSMARVAAITGASAEEMQRLESAARDAGATTTFSASEASEALQYLSMAGFTVNDAIASLPGVLSLASAAQIDLGQSADIVSNIMSGFGWEASETGTAVDILTKTMTTANTDLPRLGEAMKMVAPVSNALGISMEDTATAIGKMGDAGISGSQAGTTLRAMFLSLANPTGQTVKAMEDLGIEVTNADGAMKPLPELMGHIGDKMDGMTDAQKTQTAAQLVGREATSGFLALLEVGEDDLASYSQALTDSAGTAEEMARVQNDTVNGAFKEFKSALEEVGISIGNEYLPAVRSIIESGTDVMRWAGDLNPELISMALNFGAASAGIALATTTLIKLAGAIKGLFVSMGPAGWLITGISLLAGAVIAYNVEANKMTEVNLDNAEAMIESEAALRGQIDRYDELRGKTQLTNEEFGIFMDYNTRIANEIDPDKITLLKDEQEKLAEKSGLSNDELNEMVGLNNDLVAVLPDASTAITDHGNAILDGTDNLRDYNEEQRTAIRLELENQRIIAEANYAENLETRKSLTEEIAGHQEAVVETTDRLAELDAEILDTKGQIVTAEAEHDTLQKNRLESHLIKLEESKQKLLDNRAEEHNILLEKQEQLAAVELQLGQLDEIDATLAGVVLSEIGINGTREDGIELINEAIGKEQEQLTELENIRAEQGDINGEVNEEIARRQANINEYERAKRELEGISGVQLEINEKLQQEQSDLDQINSQHKQGKTNIDSKTEAQSGTNAKIDEGTEKARAQNEELGKDANKNVLVTDNGTIADLEARATRPVTKHVTINEKRNQAGRNRSTDFSSNPRFANHQGGPVGYRSGSMASLIPSNRLHNGGRAEEDLTGRFGYAMTEAPLFNEVDVRLLRNEMVLTEGQQANLFRTLQTGQTGGKQPKDHSPYFAQMVGLLGGIERAIKEADGDGNVNMRKLARQMEPYVSEYQAKGVDRLNRWT
ncbi:phage tail tape measure protein [Shouchella patagoniensis]|uniref:phage tail tape measure protein n=1 Tax=Shouchella patagoniensis TaxID=228576 RepID=UPI000994BE94|nr:phage tail tape measure protein [Shouchella patagoniensis]